MRLEQPFGCELDRTKQTGFVRIVAHKREVDVDLFGCQYHRGAADHKFTDPAAPETAADYDPLGVFPRFGLEITPDDQSQLLARSLQSLRGR
jgi:hypothetical protein